MATPLGAHLPRKFIPPNHVKRCPALITTLFSR